MPNIYCTVKNAERKAKLKDKKIEENKKKKLKDLNSSTKK